MQLRLGQFQGGHVGRVQAVEAGRVFQHRRVAPGAHAGQDVGNGALYRAVGGVVEGQQFRQASLEIRRGGVQSGHGEIGHDRGLTGNGVTGRIIAMPQCGKGSVSGIFLTRLKARPRPGTPR
jgi:hypothetical protein